MLGTTMDWEDLVESYNWAMVHKADPRVADWWLMSSPWSSISLVFAYFAFIWLVPKLMAQRQPFVLKGALAAYNLAMVALSMYMLCEFIATTVLNRGFSLLCSPVDYSADPMAVRLARVCWLYFFSKVVELLDTVFIVLRKKNNQISFLHVYHHSTMLLLWWLGAKFVPGGPSYFSATLNCFIHVLMYTYYFLSSLGPGVQKYLWWKKYLTVAQLTQFWAIILYMTCVSYSNCGYPQGYTISMILYIFSHVLLFSNFYRSAYGKDHVSQAGAETDASVSSNGYHNGAGKKSL